MFQIIRMRIIIITIKGYLNVLPRLRCVSGQKVVRALVFCSCILVKIFAIKKARSLEPIIRVDNVTLHSAVRLNLKFISQARYGEGLQVFLAGGSGPRES